MSEHIDNGGPAFPLLPPLGPDGTAAVGYPYVHLGMSLRDYAAIHASEPNKGDVAQAAGLGMDGGEVYVTPDSRVGIPFMQWWDSLSLERKCELRATARYAHADAMLAARKVQS